MGIYLRVGLTVLLTFSCINKVSAETSEVLYEKVKDALINSECSSAEIYFKELRFREQSSIDQGNIEFWKRLDSLVKECGRRIAEDKMLAKIGGGGGKADGPSIIGGGGSAEIGSREALPELSNMGEQEPDTDRMGLDFTSFNLPMSEPQLCQDACAGDPKCKAYTYVKPGVQDPHYARCWLKHSIPPSKVSSCCVSGVKN